MEPINKEIHLKAYFNILRRRMWLAITFFLITVTAVTIATFNQKNIYRANATVIVDSQSPDVLALKDIVKLGEQNYFAYRDYIETQQEIIKSRRTAYNVIKRLKIRDSAESKNSKYSIKALLKKLRVELMRDTRIIKISFEDEDPFMASHIANIFASVYVDSNIALKTDASAEAENWLKKEVDTQSANVRKAEINLQEYKEKNDIVSVVNKENIINDTLWKLNASYLEAQRKRIETETAYKNLVQTDGGLNLDNLPTQLAYNEIFTGLKKEYMNQQALLLEYTKVYKHKHPKMIKLVENIAYLDSKIKTEIGTIKNELKVGYEQAKQQEMDLENTLEAKKKESFELERKIIGYNALKRELEMNERMLDIVLSRLKETSISRQVQTNNVRIQDLAEPPSKPIRPKKSLNIALAFILGIIGGTGLAFFSEYMDTTLKDPQSIAALLQLNVLGIVPHIKTDKNFLIKESDIDRVVEKNPNSMASEAYRSIRTNLLFSFDCFDNSKSIVITSSLPQEGKTLTAANLAILLANSGEKVLLVDADMRKPRLHTVFNDNNKFGLSDFLMGEKDLESIVKYSGIENLYIVTSGSSTHKPTELISSGNMRAFLKQSTDRFSKVIFDTPPIEIITDAVILSSMVSGTILVVKSSKATELTLFRSKELLQKVNAKMLGMIINNVSFLNSPYPYSYYNIYSKNR